MMRNCFGKKKMYKYNLGLKKSLANSRRLFCYHVTVATVEELVAAAAAAAVVLAVEESVATAVAIAVAVEELVVAVVVATVVVAGGCDCCLL